MAFQSYDPNYTGKNYPTGFGAYGEGRASSYASGFQAPVAPAAPAPTAQPAASQPLHRGLSAVRKRTGGGIPVGGQRNVGTSQVSRIEFDPNAVMPELNIPEFTAPEFNERAVRATTQKLAAPEVRRLRDVVQQAASRNYENPNVRRMTLRQALAGYGQGLENVMAGAHREAQAEEMQEYQTEYGEALTNWEAQANAAKQVYENAFQKYLSAAPQVTERRDITDSATSKRIPSRASIYSPMGTM